MPELLIIDHKKCHGCGACESFCASRQAAASKALSRIKAYMWELEWQGVPVICQQCQEPVCASVCPQEAIYRDEDLDRVMVDYHRCIGCRMCVSACPFGAMGFDDQAKRVVNCDLCGGDPVCAAVCSYGAIQYLDPNDRLPDLAKKIKETIMGDRFKESSASPSAETKNIWV